MLHCNKKFANVIIVNHESMFADTTAMHVREQPMNEQRAQVKSTKWRGDPPASDTNRDRDIVKMAKLILADFSDISKQAAYALLKRAANRQK